MVGSVFETVRREYISIYGSSNSSKGSNYGSTRTEKGGEGGAHQDVVLEAGVPPELDELVQFAYVRVLGA